MASKKLLKKNIGYIAGDLFTEVLICKLFIPATDQDQAEVLMTRILDMQVEFVKRANRPDAKENKKRVKEYYSKLITDLQAEINSIGTEIAELSKKVNEGSNK